MRRWIALGVLFLAVAVPSVAFAGPDNPTVYYNAGAEGEMMQSGVASDSLQYTCTVASSEPWPIRALGGLFHFQTMARWGASYTEQSFTYTGPLISDMWNYADGKEYTPEDFNFFNQWTDNSVEPTQALLFAWQMWSSDLPYIPTLNDAMLWWEPSWNTRSLVGDRGCSVTVSTHNSYSHTVSGGAELVSFVHKDLGNDPVIMTYTAQLISSAILFEPIAEGVWRWTCLQTVGCEGDGDWLEEVCVRTYGVCSWDNVRQFPFNIRTISGHSDPSASSGYPGVTQVQMFTASGCAKLTPKDAGIARNFLKTGDPLLDEWYFGMPLEDPESDEAVGADAAAWVEDLEEALSDFGDRFLWWVAVFRDAPGMGG